MLAGCSWVGLEVKALDRAVAFYEDVLSMRRVPEGALPSALARVGEQVAFATGGTVLVLRRPESLPRGGLHTHYALSIPAGEYDDWWTDLERAGFDLEEHVFGDARSLYLYDPDGNCVELGQQAVEGPGIDGVFEVVLEVADLARAEALYADLGFETVDRGDDRKRVRMQGPVALELWEPHLGLASARGGVHVDLGFTAADPDAAVDAIADRLTHRERIGDGDGSDDGDAIRGRDPDGHVLTFHPA